MIQLINTPGSPLAPRQLSLAAWLLLCCTSAASAGVLDRAQARLRHGSILRSPTPTWPGTIRRTPSPQRWWVAVQPLHRGCHR